MASFGTFNPLAISFPSVPDGENTAYSNGGTIAQVLASVLEANTIYRLEVQLGNRPETPFPGFAVQLWAGNSLLAEDVSSFEPPGQGFTTSLVTYVAHARGHHGGTVAADPPRQLWVSRSTSTT